MTLWRLVFKLYLYECGIISTYFSRQVELLKEVGIAIMYYHLSNDIIENFRLIHKLVLIWQIFIFNVFGVFRYNGKRTISILNSIFIFRWKNVRRNKSEIGYCLWEPFTIYDNRQISVQRIWTWPNICFWLRAPRPPSRHGYCGYCTEINIFYDKLEMRKLSARWSLR